MASLVEVARLVVSSIVWRELSRWNRDLLSMRSLTRNCRGAKQVTPPKSAESCRVRGCDASRVMRRAANHELPWPRCASEALDFGDGRM